MFLSSTRGRFSVPTCWTAPRRAHKAVKAGRRPPPQAAQCGPDGREHGATLNQVGGARFLSDTPSGRGGLTTGCLRGYRPLLFLLATMVGSPVLVAPQLGMPAEIADLPLLPLFPAQPRAPPPVAILA